MFLKKWFSSKILQKFKSKLSAPAAARPKTRRASVKHSTVGRAYDLLSLYDRLNRLYFDGSLKIEIRWSGRTAAKAKRKVLLGSYHPKKMRITMSRRLDRPQVPLFFVEHVLFHEMLHCVFPSEKHSMHTERFRKFEKMHPDYERARAWEKENIPLLFRASDATDQLNLFAKVDPSPLI